MEIIRTISGMQQLARRWQGRRVRVGLVPTMGYLHHGHLSLVQRARQLVGRRGKVVLSIYVNPTQFAPTEDFKRYPRDLRRDAQLCRRAGVDVIFAPVDDEMYPDEYSTYVIEEALSRSMEGASRPAHFRGVTTVVAKLFNIVQPQFSVFGAKDYQQAAILQRMACDLNFPLRLVVAPTYREEDGLALSSRNKYLEGGLRAQAVALWHAIEKAQAAIEARALIPAPRLKRELKRFIESQPAARVDYIEFFDPTTLAPLKRVGRGAHIALAAWFGKTRLIDNARL